MMMFVLLALVAVAFVSGDQTDKFTDYLSDVNNLELEKALSIVNSMDTESIDPELTINGRPYLHHLYDLFMLSHSATDRKKVIDLAYKSIQKGSDASLTAQTGQYEPDLVYKSVYIRNMTMAHAVIDQLREMQQDEDGSEDEDEEKLAALTGADTFQLLYLLSCDPVPLAKMLLHANNIVRQKVGLEMAAGSTQAASGGVSEERVTAMTENIIKILSTAALVDTSSKFSFTGKDLGAFSSVYRGCIHELARRNYASYKTETMEFDDHGRNDVTLSELMDILQEMGLSLHLSLFRRMDRIDFSNELAQLLSSPNHKGRNVLHMLAISQSEKILEDIYKVLHKLVFEHTDKRSSGEIDTDLNGEGSSAGPSLNQEAVAQLQSHVLNALVQRDVRSHSPLSLVLTRFGKEAHAARILMNIFFLAVTPSEELLAQRISMFGYEPPVEGGQNAEVPVVDEDFEMLAEILKLVDYLSSPLLPKPLSAVRQIDFHSDATDQPLSGSNKFHRYYHWRGYTDDSISDLESQWSSSLPSFGGWAEGVFDLPGLAGAQGSRASAALKTRYLDSFPEHNQNEKSIEPDAETETETEEDLFRCDIEVVYLSELPSAEEFYWLYVNEGKPVIFRGVALNNTIRQVLNRENFVQKYGRERIPVATIPYANSFGVRSSSQSRDPIFATMEEMANDVSVSSVSLKGMKASTNSDLNSDSDASAEYLYAFTTELSGKLSTDIPIPTSIKQSAVDASGNLEENSDVELQFYLGPAGSGAPMHFHGNALNTMAYGMKHWFLYPPSEAFYSTQPSAAFAEHDIRARESLQCVQYGGDVMFVPSLWGHATLNRRQSIGVAHEFSVESFCMQ